MTPLFSGTTDECIKHLSNALESSRTFYEDRETIAVFCGVQASTLHRWFQGKSSPNGVPLWRARFYLKFLGYQVTELSDMDPLISRAIQICAFGVVSIEDLASLMEYAPGAAGIDSLLRIFRGTVNLTKKRRQEFQSFVEIYEPALETALKSTSRITLATSLSQAQKPLSVAPIKIGVRFKKPLVLNEVVMDAFAKMVLAMLPLAQALESDAFTDQEREQLRLLADGDKVFRLANAMFRLCGPRARDAHS